MIYRVLLIGLLAGPLFQPAEGQDLTSADRQPLNVVVILADDLGFRDLSCYGCVDFTTPSIDRLANRGIRCTNGYVSHPYCSPSRAGILSGKYQQSFGHESNPTYNEDDSSTGIDPATQLLPAVLRKAGYATGLIGKWHLGAGKPFRPNNRGFTDFYGFLGGGHHYFQTVPDAKDYDSPMWENHRPTDDKLTYLTDDLTTRAESFLSQHKTDPFCLFLMYNAPHSPNHVTEQYLERVAHIKHPGRRKYAALVQGVDEGVKRVVAKLESLQLTQKTLVIFLSDNGGRRGLADNRPLRGNKGWLNEGGIRVPFIFSLPGTLPEGSTLNHPIIALDILPTALGLGQMSVSDHLDGVDLMPFLTSESISPPHETLYWRVSGGKGYAVRHGPWKLVHDVGMEKLELYNLTHDPGESQDVSQQNPQVCQEILDRYQAWSRTLEIPRWSDGHPGNAQKERAAAEAAGTRQYPMPWVEK